MIRKLLGEMYSQSLAESLRINAAVRLSPPIPPN